MHFFLVNCGPAFLSTREYPFYAGEERREEGAGSVLGFEDFGGEGEGGAAAAVQEDDGVGVGGGWRDCVGGHFGGEIVVWEFGVCVVYMVAMILRRVMILRKDGSMFCGLGVIWLGGRRVLLLQRYTAPRCFLA